jgi:hypothetical protein
MAKKKDKKEYVSEIIRIVDKNTKYLKEIFAEGYDEDFIEELLDTPTDEVYDKVSEEIERALDRDDDILYHESALEFLLKEDFSLEESIGLAKDMGYNMDDLNSSVLAYLLKQDLMLQEWSSVEDDVLEIIEDWQSDADEE